MKKFYVALSMFLLTGTLVKAQDTLLFEDFELAVFYDSLLVDCQVDGPPPAVTGDGFWYNMDSDGDPDGSGGGRPDGWFAIQPFSVVDQYETVYGTIPAPDTNTVVGSNSWTSGLLPQQNWLITPSVKLGSNDTLFWKSAPRQTPRYLDGYQIRLSTTTNADNFSNFNVVLFDAAQMSGLSSISGDTNFANFTFSPAAAFVHGQDGMYIDNTDGGNSHVGQLRPFSYPLDAYANQDVYIAFIANSTDDNLISLDDVMIRGTTFNSINENKSDLSLNVFPNPATDNVQVNYTLTSETNVTITVYDVTGKMISTVSEGNAAAGRHFAHINTADMAKGFYTVTVQTTFGSSTTKLIVR